MLKSSIKNGFKSAFRIQLINPRSSVSSFLPPPIALTIPTASCTFFFVFLTPRWLSAVFPSSPPYAMVAPHGDGGTRRRARRAEKIRQDVGGLRTKSSQVSESDERREGGRVIHSFIHSSIHPFIQNHSFIHSFIHSFKIIHTFILSYFHTFISGMDVP